MAAADWRALNLRLSFSTPLAVSKDEYSVAVAGVNRKPAVSEPRCK
jgi:hypothetical protein